MKGFWEHLVNLGCIFVAIAVVWGIVDIFRKDK